MSGEPMKAADARALARKLAEAGLPTFPISLEWKHEKESVDKQPLTAKGFYDASTDPEVVEEMFRKTRLGPRQHWAVGVWPGPAGYIVLDVDVKNGATGLEDLKRLEEELGELPQATRVDTASGGFHLWYRRPDGGELIGNEDLAPGIEVRCDKGYVVASGVTSMWGDWKRDPANPKLSETPPLPEAWAEKIRNLKGAGGKREPIPERLTVGSRHRNLLRVAGAMRRQGAGYDEIHAALTVMNEERCDPPKPAEDIEALARDVTDRYPAEPDFDISILLPKQEGDEDRGPLPLLTLAELCAKVDAAGPRKYLVRGIWPAGAYGVHAGPMKAQKTWNGIDLAVSVASGTAWLGHHPIDDPGRVVIFAGEGGEASIVRRVRAVCESRGLQAEDLPIHVCTRAPHLRDDEHMAIFAEKVDAIRPHLVILDPLYLSAAGAKGGDLYGMGELLERGQLICDAVGASFLVVTHFNRGNRSGAERITGAGPAEWGRVLIGADVKSRHTDPDTKASTVVTVLDVIGGEVPDSAFRIKRTIAADDPDNLDSPLRYSVEVLTEEVGGEEDDMPPARRKLIEAVHALANGSGGATQRQLVDWIADKYGHGLYRTTVSTQLNEALKAGLVDCIEEAGHPTLWFLPTGGVAGVATTPTRRPATGDTERVSSSSSHIYDDDTPTPQNDAPEVSPERIAGI